MPGSRWLDELNAPQRAAATHGDGPLLIIAGAGTGKTSTLAARVACLLQRGVPAERILLLTFTRRAAQEMIRRAEHCCHALRPTLNAARVWGGTFHAIANRLLRIHGRAVGLEPDFTVLDQSDAEDLLNLLRHDLGLHSPEKRFPKKGTLLEIYSRCVNTREPLGRVLTHHFPWCAEHEAGLKQLFTAYTDRKHDRHLLDYDDLLLFWLHLMDTAEAGPRVAARFSHILVDEYQDTNRLQAGILLKMAAPHRNLTVVGDDAQSIYGFRAATVRNILDFPKQFPGAAIVTLEQNYRSLQPILQATNAVIARAPERFTKDLWSDRRSDQRPILVHCLDEAQQSRFVCKKILEHHEAGVPLRRMAVLVRTAHWSDALEVELARRGIPFVKFGGLKFLEAAHVKDLLALLRIVANPRDELSWFRVLHLLEGVGPAGARRVWRFLAANGYSTRALAHCPVPAAARQRFDALCELLRDLAGDGAASPGAQIERIRRFYDPIFREVYDHAEVRLRDLEQLGVIAAGFESREEFLAELALDPPGATGDWAGPPRKDDDWMTVSTIHSAKGCEWDVVFLIHATDGIIPSDLSTGEAAEVEEERRLLYVALTRARNWLYVCFPLRYYATKHALGDRHSFAQLTRFIPSEVRVRFEQVVLKLPGAADGAENHARIESDARARIRRQWAS